MIPWFCAGFALCLWKHGALPQPLLLSCCPFRISDSFLCSLCVPEGTATPFCPKHTLVTLWLSRCPCSCSTAFGWEGETLARPLHISQPQNIPPLPLLLSYLEQSRGEHLLCSFLVQELGLTCTKHLSCCDPGILSVVISPAP